jgi:hypothetical protein
MAAAIAQRAGYAQKVGANMWPAPFNCSRGAELKRLA